MWYLTWCSSCGRREVVKKMSAQIVSQQVVTRHCRKEVANFLKKSRHRDNMGQCFAKNGVVFLFVPFFALRKKGNLFFPSPSFSHTNLGAPFFASWFLIASYALSNMAGIPDPLDTPLSAFKISESPMQPRPDHFVLSAIWSLCCGHCASMKWPSILAAHKSKSSGQLWKSSRSKGQDEISCTNRSTSSGSTRILQTVCWSETSWYKSWVDNEVLDLMVITKVKPKNCVTSPSRRTSRANSSRQRSDGNWEVSRTSRSPFLLAVWPWQH